MNDQAAFDEDAVDCEFQFLRLDFGFERSDATFDV